MRETVPDGVLREWLAERARSVETGSSAPDSDDGTDGDDEPSWPFDWWTWPRRTLKATTGTAGSTSLNGTSIRLRGAHWFASRVPMIGTDVVVAGSALVLAVAAGLVAHEWMHALTLRLANIDYTMTYFPGRTDGVVGLLASCPWAAVRPHPTGGEPTWLLRVAALSPFLLAAPVFALWIRGVPVDSPIATAVTVGWLACSIPSPQDFSVAFYAHRALESEDAREPNTAPASCAD